MYFHLFDGSFFPDPYPDTNNKLKMQTRRRNGQITSLSMAHVHGAFSAEAVNNLLHVLPDLKVNY